MQLATPTSFVLAPRGIAEAEWHQIRARSIGGSDIAAILGMGNPRYSSPLKLYKIKRGEYESNAGEAAEWGNDLEEVIARVFGRRTGYEILPSPGTLARVGKPWMIANLDFRVDDGEGAPVPLEIKNRSAYQWKDWEEEAPDEPALQAMWYLGVTGYEHAWVAALLGGNRLRYHRIERDQELIDHLISHAEDFLRRVVEGDEPPADGSKATKEMLAHLWDVQLNKVTYVEETEINPLLIKRARLKKQLEDLKEELDEVENAMRMMAGDAEIVMTGGQIAFTNKANGTFAKKRFRETHPELAAKYSHLVPDTDVKALAEHEPEIHAAFRARRLLVPGGNQ